MIQFPAGTGIFFFHAFHPGSGANPPSYSMAIRDFSLRESGRVPEANHSHSYKADVNSERTYNSTLPYTFIRRIQNMEMKNDFL
jgi:hypothetical protein